jgi:hypothetical protein
MPVKKFRNLQDMEDSLWREPGDPELSRAIDRAWNFAARTCPRRFPPGVYRYRTMEEAEHRRDLWEEEDFQALWKRRGLDPTELSGASMKP